MTRRALLAMLAGALACGGRGTPAPYSTEATAPWTELALPIAPGRVVFSNEAMLAVHYDGGEVAALTSSWSSALEAAGMTRAADTSAEDMTSITWDGPDAVVALGVLPQEGRAEVSLSRYPK